MAEPGKQAKPGNPVKPPQQRQIHRSEAFVKLADSVREPKIYRSGAFPNLVGLKGPTSRCEVPDTNNDCMNGN